MNLSVLKNGVLKKNRGDREVKMHRNIRSMLVYVFAQQLALNLHFARLFVQRDTFLRGRNVLVIFRLIERGKRTRIFA